MPAKSKSQQKAAGAALAAKRGDQKVSDLKGPAKSMYKSMSEQELDQDGLDQAQGQTGARLEEEVTGGVCWPAVWSRHEPVAFAPCRRPCGDTSPCWWRA